MMAGAWFPLPDDRFRLSKRLDAITEREPYNGYLLFQVGIPEVEEFIRKFHK